MRWDMVDGGAPSTLDACAAACTEAGDSCVAFEIWGCLATPGACAGQTCWIMHGQVRQGKGVTVEAAATYYSDPASGNEKCFQRAGVNSSSQPNSAPGRPHLIYKQTLLFADQYSRKLFRFVVAAGKTSQLVAAGARLVYTEHTTASSVSWSPAGPRILTSGGSTGALVWDPRDGTDNPCTAFSCLSFLFMSWTLQPLSSLASHKLASIYLCAMCNRPDACAKTPVSGPRSGPASNLHPCVFIIKFP